MLVDNLGKAVQLFVYWRHGHCAKFEFRILSTTFNPKSGFHPALFKFWPGSPAPQILESSLKL